MIKSQWLDAEIGRIFLEKNALERKNHKSSGKLSASRLGDPIQWQILSWLGIPTSEPDEYSIRKMQRGKDVEDWVVGYLKPVEVQKFIEYRNVVGFVDAIADISGWGTPVKGVIAHEVKSVTNMKYKRIIKEGAQKGHILQACLYGLALQNEFVAIHYIASDDYRVDTQLLNVGENRAEIEKIIDAYEDAKLSGVVPEFEAIEDWQENPKYNKYSEFTKLSSVEIDDLLKERYPESYKKLKGII